MNIKSSICGIQHTCINYFLIFLIITKIYCWPLFKQDPILHCKGTAVRTGAQHMTGSSCMKITKILKFSKFKNSHENYKNSQIFKIRKFS